MIEKGEFEKTFMRFHMKGIKIVTGCGVVEGYNTCV